MNLMIVESPNKIKKIKAILGSGWDVAASVGHIRDLPVSEFGIEPETYRLQYQILERSKAVVSQLRQRVARSEQVLSRHRSRPRGRSHCVAPAAGIKASPVRSRYLRRNHRERDPFRP